MRRIAVLRDIAQVITSVAAAVLVVAGAYQWLGAQGAYLIGAVALTSAVLLGGQWLYRALQRLECTITTVEYHLAPNGDEYRLPEHLRDKPMRSLVTSAIERLGTGDERFDRQDRELRDLSDKIDDQIELAHAEHDRLRRQITAVIGHNEGA